MSRRVCGVRFAQVMLGPNQPQSTEKMDQSQESKNQRGETIASFGEGYAMRSNEEGFGGIYGGNRIISKEDEEKIVHGNVPEYDKSQGSEVKEKERVISQNKVES
ncbi:uncharacterized protein LOC111408371 [Olea europaea var. sylvestris]|uniref:uncharacterized protein LOC111408371 n=1 Tax=Olea europaea var. sylvestris TaxID=158386 RepID=UPI000C1D55EF|nr:uncharacterized protein LOC111408371 [Olea europaea var. sylvestris]